MEIWQPLHIVTNPLLAMYILQLTPKIEVPYAFYHRHLLKLVLHFDLKHLKITTIYRISLIVEITTIHKHRILKMSHPLQWIDK